MLIIGFNLSVKVKLFISTILYRLLLMKKGALSQAHHSKQEFSAFNYRLSLVGGILPNDSYRRSSFLRSAARSLPTYSFFKFVTICVSANVNHTSCVCAPTNEAETSRFALCTISKTFSCRLIFLTFNYK